MAAHNQGSSLLEMELVKAVNIWRIEEGRITRVPVLFGRGIGCTASEKKH
jgi:hypothetical protein